MNKVILIGHLATEPEIRQTPNGINVTRFVVAVQRRYQKDGEKQADFITCIAWRKTAEFVYQYFHKGSGIQICGNLQSRSWTGDDGKKRYATEVVVDEVEFNGKKNDNEQNGGVHQMQTGYAAEQKYGQTTVYDKPEPQDDEFADIGDFNESDLPF